MATRGEAALSIIALMDGIEISYNDFGHPERAKHRKYWSVFKFGVHQVSDYTRESVALRYLHKIGIHVDQNLEFKLLNESFGDDDGGGD